MYENIGLVYKELKDYERSLDYLYDCIGIKEKFFGLGCISLASTVRYIGEIYEI